MNDVALAAAVAAVTLVEVGSQSFGEQADAARGIDPLGVALCAAAALPLVLRRRSPLSTLALTLAASVALVAADYAALQPPGPAVALAATAQRGGRRENVLGLGLAGVAYAAFVAAAAVRFGPEPGEHGLTAALWVGGWIVGERARLARERAEQERERRDGERRLAVAEERARIARDLHDSAGHALNSILIQAGAARLVHGSRPERSREAIEAIEALARETVTDLDGILGRLRAGAATERAPLPGLERARHLVQQHRRAGLDFRLVDRTNGDVPVGVGRTAFRILQEALTNAARHGDGRADVLIEQDGGHLKLCVTNPVVAPAPVRPSGGHGIPGMEERAALAGGVVFAGRRDGCFEVRAELPLGEGPA